LIGRKKNSLSKIQKSTRNRAFLLAKNLSCAMGYLRYNILVPFLLPNCGNIAIWNFLSKKIKRRKIKKNKKIKDKNNSARRIALSINQKASSSSRYCYQLMGGKKTSLYSLSKMRIISYWLDITLSPLI
jgi:hypothetical protein